MLFGWCEKCRKLKRVRVTRPVSGGVQIGVCPDCESKR